MLFWFRGGDIGVAVFFIITGYFLISSKKPRNLRKVIIQTLFYSVLSAIVLVVLKLLKIEFVSYETIGTQLLLPISGSIWWFVSAYVLLCLSSISINSYVAGMSRRNYQLMLVALWCLWIIGGKVLDVKYYSILRAFWYYLLGGWFRKYDITLNKGVCITGFVACWAAYAILTYQIGYIIGNRLDYSMHANVFKLLRAVVLGPVAGVFLFALFKDLMVEDNPSIYWLASCTLGIYLLHESSGGRILFWKEAFHISGSIYDSIWYPLYTVFACLCIIGMGIAIETAWRKLLPLSWYPDLHFNKENKSKISPADNR